MGYHERQRIGSSWVHALCVGCALLVSSLGACAKGDDDDDGHSDEAGHAHDADVGPLSGATCPTDHAALTYDAFGKPFMEKYCTGCHSSKLKTAAERMGATEGHDFDNVLGIKGVAKHIDEKAASGPSATNTAMPPPAAPGEKPTLAEREKLGQWIACEFPIAD